MASPTTHNLSLEELDKQTFAHPFVSAADHQAAQVRIFERAEGIHLTDTAGRSYIDCVSGMWCVNVGYGRKEIARAIYEQAQALPFYHTILSFSNSPAIRLADRVLRLVPPNMGKVFFGTSGSDANDTQVKIVWYYNNLLGRPEKKKIISRLRGFHGSTVASASLTGLPGLHKGFDLPLPGFLHVAAPDIYRGMAPGESEVDYSRRLAAELDAFIEAQGPETVAAFIAEPVMGGGGGLIPSEGYFPEIQKVLRKHDVLMIVDEVICGFGRLGTWFGSHRFRIEPDLMTLAKGITSGYQPLSAVVLSDKVWSVLSADTEGLAAFGGGHGFTYSGHPVAAAAALANLDILEGEDLVGNAARMGAYFRARLDDAYADHPLVGQIRGAGLFLSLELVTDRAAKTPFPAEAAVEKRIMYQCLEEGLMVRGMQIGNAVGFGPPLVITEAEIDEIMARFDRAFGTVADGLAREGLV